MKVKQIMTSEIVSVEMDDPISRVKEIFDQLGFHHLLVIDNQRLQGILSDRDLLKAISPYAGTVAETARDAHTLNKRVHQIMTRKPVSVDQNISLHEAISVFNQNKVSCLPVLGECKQVVGILSWRDIFKAFEVSRKANR